MHSSGRHTARPCWESSVRRDSCSPKRRRCSTELCDQRGLADALRWRSEVEDKAGEYVLAAALAERVTAIGEAIGDDDIAMMGKSYLFNPLFSRAVVDGDRQAAERAYALAEAGLKYETEKSDSSSLERAAALSALAGSLFALGEYAKSITTAQRSLRDMPMIETGGTLMVPVMVIGFSACAGGEPGHGMQLIAAAMKHNRDEGITPGSLDVVRERLERQARAALGEEGYEAAVLAGEALSVADTIKLALTPVLFAASPRRTGPDRLIIAEGWGEHLLGEPEDDSAGRQFAGTTLTPARDGGAVVGAKLGCDWTVQRPQRCQAGGRRGERLSPTCGLP